jgi:uncharacterized protein YdeI (YjbR/CyaY-like superfamily)
VKPTFFERPEDFRAWLGEHHDTARELWVGFRKKGSGQPSITWPEAVDEALCFGWIDGIRKSIDETSYANRFTPRKRTSNWSAINVARVTELTKQGRMRPAGLAAFEERTERKTGVYSYENRHQARLDDDAERTFRANEAVWAFFQSQPPSYRQTAIFWVVSAKREETRARRLATLIDCSEKSERIPALRRPETK